MKKTSILIAVIIALGLLLIAYRMQDRVIDRPTIVDNSQVNQDVADTRETKTPGENGVGCTNENGFCVGIEELAEKSVYVIHSPLYDDGEAINTVGIYVFNGGKNSVWLFGAGYGNPEDMWSYRKNDGLTTRGAMTDAQDVTYIINDVFQHILASTKVNIIVPSFHLDHINQEFIHGLVDQGIQLQNIQIQVHAESYRGATCNLPCCGETPCTQKSEFFGAPYDEPWTKKTLERFTVLGNASDACGKLITSFSTLDGDSWDVQYGISTQNEEGGVLNLLSKKKGWLITGADGRQECLPSGAKMRLNLHGNSPFNNTNLKSSTENSTLPPVLKPYITPQEIVFSGRKAIAQAPENNWNKKTIIVLHGRTQEAGVWFDGESDQNSFVEMAIKNGFFVVAPDSSSPYCQRAKQWDYTPSSTDFPLFEEMMKWLKYNIGTQEIFVVGISSGGFMTERLANKYSAHIDGVVIHSAGSYDNAVLNTSGVCGVSFNTTAIPQVSSDHPRTYMLHGEKDNIVKFEIGEILANQLKSRGIEVEFYKNPLGKHQWFKEKNQPILDWLNK